MQLFSPYLAVNCQNERNNSPKNSRHSNTFSFFLPRRDHHTCKTTPGRPWQVPPSEEVINPRRRAPQPPLAGAASGYQRKTPMSIARPRPHLSYLGLLLSLPAGIPPSLIPAVRDRSRAVVGARGLSEGTGAWGREDRPTGGRMNERDAVRDARTASQSNTVHK